MKECHGRKSLTIWLDSINAGIQGGIFKRFSQKQNSEKVIATNMAVFCFSFSESAVLGVFERLKWELPIWHTNPVVVHSLRR